MITTSTLILIVLAFLAGIVWDRFILALNWPDWEK